MSSNHTASKEGTAGTTPPSLSSVRRGRFFRGGLIIGLVLVLAAAAVALIGQYSRTVQLERAATEREAATVIGAVEAGIDVHVRPGARYMENRLQSYLDSLVDTSPALAISLIDESDEHFMSAGEADLLDDPTHSVEAAVDGIWTPREGRARFQRRVHSVGDSRRGSGRGPRGREQWADFPSGSYAVSVVMDTGDLTERMAAARARLIGSLIGLLALAGLGGLALSLAGRRRRLEDELWRAEERAAQHERLTRLGAGLAHETRNPLGVVRGLMQSIATDTSSTEAMRQIAKDAIDEVDRTVGRINSFLQLARPVDPSPSPVRIGDLLADVSRLLSTESAAGTSIERRCEEERLTVSADPDMLRRALFNLGLNALKATSENGKVVFAAKRAADGAVELCVEDDGSGIEAEDLPRVTEPYFTRAPGGSGLGLSIVERIAGAHGWTFRIDSEPGSGTRVYLGGLRPVR